MKVAEIRDLLKKYSSAELQELIVEMYKVMPKSLKEEKDIDSLLADFSRQMSAKKQKKEPEPVDMEWLTFAVPTFVEYAMNQYYFAPNRVISKKERPKWRSQVKNFLKELQRVPATGEEGIVATELIQELYKVVAYGSRYHVFNTTNTFKAVDMDSVQFSELIITRILANGFNSSTVHKAVSVATTIDPSPIPYYSSILYTVSGLFPTVDSKLLALDQCRVVRKEIQQRLQQVRGSGTMLHYELGTKLDMVTGLELILHIELAEEEKAVKQFMKFYDEKNKEVKIYVLVQFLEILEKFELIKRIIADAIQQGVPVREQLLKEYGHSI